MMFTVTLIGADGSGKSTIGQNIQQSLKLPTAYVYMGENPKTATHMLPTTRLWVKLKRAFGNPELHGPPDPSITTSLPKISPKRLLKEIKSAIRLANLIAEEWYRQVVIWYFHARRCIVITDRHFYLDYYYHHIHPYGQSLTLAAYFHGYMLAKLYPKPDLVIFLDAPAKVLFTRKGEGTLELLESRRQEYINLSQAVKQFHTLDATQSIETVTQQASDLILAYARGKFG